MSVAPCPVKIEDLANPKFPDDALPIIEQATRYAGTIRFDADSIFEQAAAETGLDDFGADPGIFERVRFFVHCLNAEANLSDLGRAGMHTEMVRWLKNRLRLEELYRKNPEINDLEVKRPIVIVGLPRSGTTHLNNLLSADPQLSSLPYWEGLEPVLPEDERLAKKGEDPRRARWAAQIDQINTLMPLFRNMHDYTVDHIEEEWMLMAPDFSWSGLECFGVMPTWRDWYKSTDQTPHYDYLKRALRALQWLRGGDRWVLKCPQHLEQIRPLMQVFPDSTVVFTYRDPSAVIASAATMISYHARVLQKEVNTVAIAHYWADRIEDFLRAFIKDRHLVPESQACHVKFRDFMKDEMGTLKKIYAAAEQPLSESSVAAMENYALTHPRGRYGRIVYDLAEFGLDAASLQERFRFYTDEFSVELEHSY